MSNISVDFNKPVQRIKRMNAVNNGPIVSGCDQIATNEQSYRELCIPYARNHDASFCTSYGGRFSVDIQNIFTDFDADENDENNYDFACTDKCIKDTLSVGTKIYYRLGTAIEHQIKKYFIKPPKDFAKWARICEHIIAHYNKGWANGFHYNIEYWEIWNEPDGWEDEPPERRQTWGGTREEFFELFKVTAKHLKSKFPEIKIGGPALGFNKEWADQFFALMSENQVPIDFFSWHIYSADPYSVAKEARAYEKLLNEYGYTNTESHCTEWAYVSDFMEGWLDSVRHIIGLKGSAYVSAVMQDCQNAPVDMLMYYDFRPGKMNGVFDFYDYHKLKTYFIFAVWRDFSKLGTQTLTVNEDDDKDLFVTAATDKNGNGAVSVTYYQIDDENTEIKEIKLKFEQTVSNGKVYLLDKTKDLELVSEFSGNTLELSLTPNSTVMLNVNY